ncbi:hypothetical protein B0I35DRAFT_435686 [Stachybotrys elegans]|uniref:Uncharacterized protein n=1 Tax=Stachybotrys elegans TaxID=80388 RepID=A0A8K0WP55_9HYPO|nr:hypothetical protein B0I35DRAFT_435686 [Stachybotrys elegans]
MAVDDAHISVRFKHGIHTIYLFVDALAPMAAATKELLELLRERYPGGLTTSLEPPKTTEVPEGDVKVAYAVLKVAHDPYKGWKKLDTGDDEFNPTKIGLKANSIVAFSFVEDEDEEPVFEVEWPRDEEEP